MIGKITLTADAEFRSSEHMNNIAMKVEQAVRIVLAEAFRTNEVSSPKVITSKVEYR